MQDVFDVHIFGWCISIGKGVMFKAFRSLNKEWNRKVDELYPYGDILFANGAETLIMKFGTPKDMCLIENYCIMSNMDVILRVPDNTTRYEYARSKVIEDACIIYGIYDFGFYWEIINELHSSLGFYLLEEIILNTSCCIPWDMLECVLEWLRDNVVEIGSANDIPPYETRLVLISFFEYVTTHNPPNQDVYDTFSILPDKNKYNIKNANIERYLLDNPLVYITGCGYEVPKPGYCIHDILLHNCFTCTKYKPLTWKNVTKNQYDTNKDIILNNPYLVLVSQLGVKR